MTAPKTEPLAITPANAADIEALFRALAEFMAKNSYTSASLSGYMDAAGVNMTITAADANGNYTYSQRWNNAVAPAPAS